MSIEDLNPPEKLPEKISEVEPIAEGRGRHVRTREELKNLVEIPLLATCEELYDKNIRTLSTSANKNDIGYEYNGISIDFDSLSEQNKEIGKQLGRVDFSDNINQLFIPIPVTEESTIEEIKTYAESLAHKFSKQPLTWSPTYTIEEMRQIYGI